MKLDWLNEFSKEEIIAWIKSETHFLFHPPTKSKLLWLRWEAKSKELMAKRNKSIEMLKACDGKGRDELAAKFNGETDLNKRLAVLKQMKPFDDKFKKWLAFDKAVAKEEVELDRLYERIDIARKEEI